MLIFPWQIWVLLALGLVAPLIGKLINEVLDAQRYAKAGLSNVKRMTGRDFEKYLGHLFRGLGYRVELTPESGDYGVDLILTDSTGHRVAVQAKRWKGKVGVKAIQEVLGGSAYYKCHETLVVTTAEFTNQAKIMAGKTETRLWAIDELADAMERVRTSGKVAAARVSAARPTGQPESRKFVPPVVQAKTATRTPIGTPSMGSTPACPQCDSGMVERRANGRKVWLCSRFPSCKGYRLD
jgi:restriction system protein